MQVILLSNMLFFFFGEVALECCHSFPITVSYTWNVLYLLLLNEMIVVVQAIMGHVILYC